MKLLLLISLSVVFCFSCSTLDTSPHTYSGLLYPIFDFQASYGGYKKGKDNLSVSIKWRFISYSIVDDNLEPVKVKGGFRINYVNDTTKKVLVGNRKFIFYDKEDFKILTYWLHGENIEIPAFSNNTDAGNFELLLDNKDLMNDIERLELEIHVVEI